MSVDRDRPTLIATIRDLGWFSTLFASIVSAPSLLALLQMIFVEHRLIDALQWIVDGYNDIVSVLGAVPEPLLAPVIAWLNAVLDWQIVLQPHWRPLFLLAMVRVSASARLNLRPPIDVFDTFLSLPLLTLATLGGVVVASSIPLGGDWREQGAIAATLVSTMRVAMALLGAMSELVKTGGISFRFLSALIDAIVFTLVAFLLGAGLSFIPGLQSGAGIIGFGALLLAEGALSLAMSSNAGSVYSRRLGLIILGGFVTAGLILGADVAIRVLSQ